MLGSSWKPLRIRKNLYGITYTYMYTSCVVERPYICIRPTYTRRTVIVGAVPNPTYLYDLRRLRRLIHLPYIPPFLYTYIYTYTTYVYKLYMTYVDSTELRCYVPVTRYIYTYTNRCGCPYTFRGTFLSYGDCAPCQDRHADTF